MKEKLVKRSEVEKIFWSAEVVLNSYKEGEELKLENILDIFNTCKNAFEELQSVNVANEYASKEKVLETLRKGLFMARNTANSVTELNNMAEILKILKEDVEAL